MKGTHQKSISGYFQQSGSRIFSLLTSSIKIVTPFTPTIQPIILKPNFKSFPWTVLRFQLTKMYGTYGTYVRTGRTDGKTYMPDAYRQGITMVKSA